MSVASPIFPIAVLAACLALADILARSGTGRELLATAPGGAHRFEAIDGLRGFLAFGVFLTHVMTTRGYYANGIWDASFAPFFVVSGQAGVALFFMITGFLYWNRVLSPRGLEAGAFFRSRLRRLVPMYLVSVACVFVAIAACSGFRLQSDALQLARDIRPWLSFGFMSTGPLNGVVDAHQANAVYWTLAIEWGFYLVLPLAALFARGRSFGLLIALALVFGVRAPISLAFVAGILVAAAMERGWLPQRLASPWLTAVPVAAITAVFCLPTAYSPVAIALLGVGFASIAAGNDLLGLLSTRAARLLGAVSYSFYLLHCVVLYVVFHAVDAHIAVGSLAPAQHWIVALGSALAAVGLSVLTCRYVERPFLASRRAISAPDLSMPVHPVAG